MAITGVTGYTNTYAADQAKSVGKAGGDAQEYLSQLKAKYPNVNITVADFNSERQSNAYMLGSRGYNNICISKGLTVNDMQDENENMLCTFVDIPGFRQRLSDKYRGFFEGDIGIAVLKITELIELYNLINIPSSDENNLKIDDLIERLFEPIRVWCDYRSPNNIIIVISQIDLVFDKQIEEEMAKEIQIQYIKNAIDCVNLITERFSRGVRIPISPISIKLTTEENKKTYPPMSVFFRRVEENIYFETENKNLPGSGTLISCLGKMLTPSETNNNINFSMASVDQIMKTVVGAAPKTVLNVHAIHGSIHKSDNVVIGPMLNKASKEIVYATCNISSIKADGAQQTSDILLRGNVGGIIFNSINDTKTGQEYILSYNTDKSDISILKSTILFNGSIAKGDILEIVIDESEYINTNGSVDEIYSRVISSLMPYDEIFLFWYGKKISVNVVEIIMLKNVRKISVIISKNEKNSTKLFVLPVDEKNEPKYKDNVILAIPRSYYSTLPIGVVQGKFTYVSCCISSIKDSKSFNMIGINAAINLYLDELLNDTLFFNHICEKDGTVRYNIPIVRGKKNLDIYPIYKRISHSIKSYYNHRAYQDFGGLEIQLLHED